MSKCYFCKSTGIKKFNISVNTKEVPAGLTRKKGKVEVSGIKCHKCGSLKYENRENVNYDTGYYSNENNYSHKVNLYSYSGRLIKNIRLIINKTKKIKILELGPGSGSIGSTLQNFYHNIEIDCIEPDSGFDSQLKLNGYKNYYKIEKLPLNIKYDLILGIGVLEHLNDPKSDLLNILSYLKADGTAIFQYPNIKSISAKIFFSKWDMNFEDGHISIPSLTGLKKIINEFSLVNYHSSTIMSRGRLPFVPIRLNDVEKKVKKYKESNLIFRVIISKLFAFQDFFMLGETICVYFKKK